MVDREGMRRIALDTEAMAWEALDDLIHDRIDAENAFLDFSKAKWVEARFKFEGSDFHQSLFPSTMKGVVDFQNAYYKTVALIIKNDPRVTRLTDSEKDEFEINFSIGKGSTELIATVAEQVGKLGDRYFENMSPKQKLSLAVLIALLFFGGYALTHYLTHVENIKQSDVDIEKVQTLRQAVEGAQRATSEAEQTARQISKDSTEHLRILAEAYKRIDGAKTVGDLSIDGVGSIIKQSYRAESIVVKDGPISRAEIQEITRQTRRKPEDITVTRAFKVTAVDGSAERGFTVRLQAPQSELTITATLSDAIARDRYGKVLQQAFWSKSVKNIQIQGRLLGEDIIDAKILSAKRIRN